MNKTHLMEEIIPLIKYNHNLESMNIFGLKFELLIFIDVEELFIFFLEISNIFFGSSNIEFYDPKK